MRRTANYLLRVTGNLSLAEVRVQQALHIQLKHLDNDASDVDKSQSIQAAIHFQRNEFEECKNLRETILER